MNHRSYNRRAGLAAAAWGIAGFAWILLDAIIRLSVLAARGLSEELSSLQWLSLILFVLFMAYTEGYRGFQRSFSPRTAARAWWLYRHPAFWRGLLAPLWCMGFFGATRKALLIAWVGTGLIVALIVALRYVPQPWRAMVDAGVVVGLSWGLLSFLWWCRRVFREDGAEVSPEVPHKLR